MEKLVIIPTYNEKENIENIINYVFNMQLNYHILVIDDGSPDGTAQIVQKMIDTQFGDKLFIIQRSGKLGLGTAYITGFKWALQKGYQFIFEMDADFSHNPDDLERLYKACTDGGADMAIGSRYVPGGKIENWPLKRKIYSRGGAIYTKMITWSPINDQTAGFICYSRKVLDTIDLDTITYVGYAFQVEMKFAAWKLGFKIKEVPITFVDRRAGISKMSKGIIKEGIIGVLKLQYQSMFGNYKTKIRKKN